MIGLKRYGIIIYNDGIAPHTALDVKMPCPMLGIAKNDILHTGVASFSHLAPPLAF